MILNSLEYKYNLNDNIDIIMHNMQTYYIINFHLYLI